MTPRAKQKGVLQPKQLMEERAAIKSADSNQNQNEQDGCFDRLIAVCTVSVAATWVTQNVMAFRHKPEVLTDN